MVYFVKWKVDSFNCVEIKSESLVQTLLQASLCSEHIRECNSHVADSHTIFKLHSEKQTMLTLRIQEFGQAFCGQT